MNIKPRGVSFFLLNSHHLFKLWLEYLICFFFSQQKIFIEYIMLDGVNDEEQHAHQLGKLLETFESVSFKLQNSLYLLHSRGTSHKNYNVMLCYLWQVINLIPFNPIGSLSSYTTSDDQKVIKFQRILRGIYNIRTTIRKQMGQDISGACGQLVINKKSSISSDPLTDIEDLHIWWFSVRPTLDYMHHALCTKQCITNCRHVGFCLLLITKNWNLDLLCC